MATAQIDLRPWGWAPGYYSLKCEDCPKEERPLLENGGGGKGSWRCRSHAIDARTKSLTAECGDAALCEPCSLPTHELTQQPGCGAPMETIVAAAIRFQLPKFFRQQQWQGEPVYPEHVTISAPPPARHGTLMHPTSCDIGVTKAHDQGFLTSTGRYVGREEGLQVALDSGQAMIDHPSRHATLLFSEDLW